MLELAKALTRLSTSAVDESKRRVDLVGMQIHPTLQAHETEVAVRGWEPRGQLTQL